jgi:hypothetical protein
MHLLKNKDGFALVTALMFTLLSLMLTLTLLYMVTASVQTSSSLKKYHTATEAAHGGVELLIKDIINNNIMNAATLSQGDFATAVGAYADSASANCLQKKLTLPTSQWGSACSDVSLGATEAHHDLKFVLNSDPGTPGFNVYAKIVDTMAYVYTDYTPTGQVVTTTTAGNTDLSTVQLEGGGVTSAAASTNPSQPHMYRIEVQASKPNSTETSKVSVQYAY